MLNHQKTYRFRMRPTRAQENSLLRLAGACRWVWNWVLARRKEYHKENGKGIPRGQLSAELTALKIQPETSWLKEADSQALQQVLRDLDRAFDNFFQRRAKFPKFKSKTRSNPSFRIPQRVKVSDGKVYVPKVGFVRIRQSQPIEGQTKSATFKRDALGHWYVTLVVAFSMPDVALPRPNPDKVVGIDLGLKDFAVFSDGEKVENPRVFRKTERKLRKAQKTLCRRQKGSRRREKAKKRVARLHRKAADQRKDFLHKLSTRIVKEFDGVCVEDLCVKGLARTKLAKSVLDASHGEFRRMIQYKCEWQRKHFVMVGRFFPSSKTCGICEYVNDALTLADRTWTCPKCGTLHDRDLNAAGNVKCEGLRILAAGHADSNARGADVRPGESPADGVEPRIPRL